MKLSIPQKKRSVIALSATLSLVIAASSEAAFVSYYVGVDSHQTVASGVFQGLSNPNANRLTFLYAHTYPDTPANNHYHSKGIFRYTGPNLGEGLTATELSTSNYVPEGTNPPLNLSFASGGVYDGKLVSASIAGNSFSFLTMEDTGKLSGFAPGSPEAILFNSSTNRWNGALTGADVHMELVSLSAGLNVGSASALNLFVNPGDEFHLDASFNFMPVFWTDANAAPGNYTAQFKLTDESNTFRDSGTFEYRFSVIPEPSSALLAAVGTLALLRRRR